MSRVDIYKGKADYPVTGMMRFEPAEDPFELDRRAMYRLFRQQEEIPDDDEAIAEAAAAQKEPVRRRRSAKRLRWVIEERAKRKGGLVLHGKDAAKEDTHFMVMVLNPETKRLEMTPVEQYIRFHRVVEAFGTLTKREDIESVIKPGRAAVGRKKEVAEEDDSRFSRKQRIMKFAETFEREQEELRAGGGGAGKAVGGGKGVDKNWEGKVGGAKYWRVKSEALEREVTGGLEQEDGTREILGFGADDPDDYVPDDDDEGHLMEEQAMHQTGPGWIEEEDESEEEEDEEEEVGVVEKVGPDGAGMEEEGEVVKMEEEPERDGSQGKQPPGGRKSGAGGASGRVSPGPLPGDDGPRARILGIFGGLGMEVEYAVMRRELQEQLKADKDGTTRALRDLANLVQDGMGQRVWKLKAEYAQRK